MSGVDQLGGTEISNLNVHVGSHQEVLRLQVTVNVGWVKRMEIMHSTGGIDAESELLVCREPCRLFLNHGHQRS